MKTVLSGDPAAKLPNGAGRPKRILVVDDEPLILDLLVRTKNIENCEIVLARDGEEAWEKLQTAQYDCIILDIKMPWLWRRGDRDPNRQWRHGLF